MTPEQKVALKNNILASTDPAVMEALANRNDTELVRLYNLPSTFVIWRTDTSKSAIFGAITWKNLTPIDTPDGTQLYTNRSHACEGKQMTLQTMLISPGTTLNMADQSIRDGIKDSLQNLPSGVGGALLDAGWAATKTVSTRLASVVEKIFATGAGTSTNPGTTTYEGTVNITIMGEALNG